MRPAPLLPLVLLIAVLVVPAPAAAQTDSISVERKIAGLSLVWQEANYNFAYFGRLAHLDWDSEYEAAITRVLATATDRDYIREVQRFVALLNEAHANVEPGRAFRASHGGHPAVELEEIERNAVVVNTSVELAGDIPVGSVIRAIDGIPVQEYLRTEIFPYMSASTEHYLWRQSIRGDRWRAVGLLVGDVGSEVILEIETPRQVRRSVTLQRLPTGAEIEWFRPSRRSVPPLEFKRMDDHILYFALNTFNTPDIVPAFEEHLDELETARAVILDIRGNGGGNSSHGWQIGRFFSDVPLEVSHWRTRAHRAAYKAWGRFSDDPDRRAYYEMDAWYSPDSFSIVEKPGRTYPLPVAILIGPSTYSAAEDFLAFMRPVPNVFFVGETSAGSTGQPLVFQIPGGAWVGITSKHDTMPDGTEFVGVGVAPDISVRQTVEAYRSGRDPVLSRALEELRSRIR
ncbi:MAG: S41 family peptidase [Rhodothermales bacterium]|nr:S41 family peptidase [Rhodothermales bacterium]